MKRTPLRKVSDKKRAQLADEKKLTEILYIKQKGLCADCGDSLGWGAAKHEIIFRSHGGSPTDEDNCVLLCLTCHSARHGIRVIMEGK